MAARGSREATGNANVTAIASAASGEARPLAFISFLLSKKIVPLESGLVLGPVRSAFSCLSGAIDAVFNQSRNAPHSSARLLPHITWFLAFQPKLTPRTLYRCSTSRSSMPYPSPPSSITVSVGLYSSIASMTCPTVVIVSSPRYRLIAMMSRPWRTAMTVESPPDLAGSMPITIGAVSSLCLGRPNA